MLKKFLLPISAIAAMSLVACGDSESSSSGSVGDKATCEVNKNSKDLFRMTIVVPDSGKVTVEAAKNGDVATYSSVIEFDKSIPEKEIQNACEEAKKSAEGDDEISCKDRTVSTKATLGPEAAADFSRFTANLEKQCDHIQNSGNMGVDDEELGGENGNDDHKGVVDPADPGDKTPDSSPSTENNDPNRVTCRLDQNSSEGVQVTIVVPDSATIVYKVVYPADSAMTLQTVTFDKAISEKEVQAFCDEYKADAEEDGAEVTCKDRTVSLYSKVEDELSAAFLPLFGIALIASCDEIKETGKLPDTSEGDDWGDDDDWGDGDPDSSGSDEDEDPIFSSPSGDEPISTELKCDIDKDSDTWVVGNEGAKTIYKFEGTKVSSTTVADYGSEELCQMFMELMNSESEEDVSLEASCEGSVLSLTTSEDLGAEGKEFLLETLKDQCKDL